MLLKSTTRHVRIFSAEIVDGEMAASPDKLTLDVDPDNELNWNDDALQSVYRKFDELVDSFAGAELTDYNLRCIGSDLEHFVRSLLQSGEVTYNLDARVQNYSFGLPRTDSDISV
ncbi:MAG: NAD(P)H-quinone oxidoreductase subunit M [Cyanobacteria bacterium P01_A01_bin.135]